MATRGRPRTAPVTDASSCVHCGRVFAYSIAPNDPIPRCCGRIPCRQLEEFTAADWERYARFARIHQGLGAPLSELEEIALRKADA